MSSFKALVKEDVKANRLLSLAGGNGMPEISITPVGETPNFRSNNDLEADTEVTVTLLNNPVWEIEAGEDLSAGSYVEVGEGGVIVASSGTGIGYVAEAVEEGAVAKLIRQSTGERGPQGPKGDKGAKGDKGDPGKDAEPQFTEEQVAALLALIEDQ